jgi:hypothetical protein
MAAAGSYVAAGAGEIKSAAKAEVEKRAAVAATIIFIFMTLPKLQ